MNLEEYVHGLTTYLNENPHLADKQVVGFKESQELVVKHWSCGNVAYVLPEHARCINGKVLSYNTAYDAVKGNTNSETVIVIC